MNDWGEPGQEFQEDSDDGPQLNSLPQTTIEFKEFALDDESSEESKMWREGLEAMEDLSEIIHRPLISTMDDVRQPFPEKDQKVLIFKDVGKEIDPKVVMVEDNTANEDQNKVTVEDNSEEKVLAEKHEGLLSRKILAKDASLERKEPEFRFSESMWADMKRRLENVELELYEEDYHSEEDELTKEEEDDEIDLIKNLFVRRRAVRNFVNETERLLREDFDAESAQLKLEIKNLREVLQNQDVTIAHLNKKIDDTSEALENQLEKEDVEVEEGKTKEKALDDFDKKLAGVEYELYDLSSNFDDLEASCLETIEDWETEKQDLEKRVKDLEATSLETIEDRETGKQDLGKRVGDLTKRVDEFENLSILDNAIAQKGQAEISTLEEKLSDTIANLDKLHIRVDNLHPKAKAEKEAQLAETRALRELLNHKMDSRWFHSALDGLYERLNAQQEENAVITAQIEKIQSLIAEQSESRQVSY